MTEFFQRILVPSDGSVDADSAFPALMPIVRAYAPEIAVLHVFEDPEAPFSLPERIAKTCATLRATDINVHLDLREGDPAEEILRTARDKRMDLIAIATHGRGGLSRMIVGSVTEQVLRESDIPVLVTRPSLTIRTWKRIVVALDGSERGEAILPEALRLARKLGASVDLLRVAQPIMAAAAGEVPVVLPPEDPLPYLKQIIQTREFDGIDVRAVAREGGAAEQILAYLKESGASLLCMTTHGRSGLARLLMGSVAEQVLRHSTCPVLLRRTVEETAAAPASPRMNLQAR